jgi:hypothetical protein
MMLSVVQVVYTITLALKIVILSLWCLPRFLVTKISVASATVGMISTLALLLLSHYDHARSLKPSSLICLYLLVSIIFEIAQVRTLWLFHPTSYPLATTATAALVVRSLSLVLEARENKETPSPQLHCMSPENFTGIFSQSTYWWLNGLFMSGFRGELSLDDLFPLDEKLLTKNLISRGDQQGKYNKGDMDDLSQSH